MINMKKLFYKWHRRLAWVVGIPVLLWALSGILHPVMGNWFKAEIENRFIPPIPLSISKEGKAPSAVVPTDLNISFLKLVSVAGESAYLVETEGKVFRLFSASTGREIPLEEYLTAQARLYAGDTTSPFKKVTRLDHFDSKYSGVNRYLPVYRVALDREDGLEVIIDPRTGKMAAFDKPYVRVLKTCFGWFHTFSFLGRSDQTLRVLVVSVLSFLALTLGLSGLINLFLFRTKTESGTKRKMGLGRKLHRIFGAFAFLFFLMFSLSGFLHALAKFDYDDTPQVKQSVEVSPAMMSASPFSLLLDQPVLNVSLAYVNEQAYYRVVYSKGREKVVKFYDSGSLIEWSGGEQAYLKALTAEFSKQVFGEQQKVSETSIVTSFSKEYGFISRRLPVWKQSLDNGTSMFVDTQDSALSKVVTPWSKAEGFSFSMIHKFHFIDPLSKETRDWVSAIGSGLVALVASFGILLLLKKRA